MEAIWTVLIITLAVVSWPTPSTGQQLYIGTIDHWAFFKVKVTGPMTNANVKATCEGLGIRYPCHHKGTGSSTCLYNWEQGCIMYTTGYWSGSYCETHRSLARTSCGSLGPGIYSCGGTVDTFVYMPNWLDDDSACGVDAVTETWCVQGASYHDMYAVCADVDHCESSPCVHGYCRQEVGGYSCNCQPGWEGTNCDHNINDCASFPCVHGTCTDAVGKYTCSCENGWEGTNCDRSIMDCASSPCAHGACTDELLTYTCSCENGWTGPHCSQVLVDMDDCASNPCWFGGTCVDHIHGYSCVCPKGVGGRRCETVSYSGRCYRFSTDALSHYDAQQVCSTNNGRLVEVKDEQEQNALANGISSTTGTSSWLGMKFLPPHLAFSDGSVVAGPLQWSASEPAAPCDLCVLLDSNDSFLAKTAPCTEQHNYVCQSGLASCGQGVCQNGGNCTSCFQQTFCDCPNGFEGEFCEITVDFCALVTCPFDWVCQNHADHFVCLTPTARMAEPYQCSSASCPDDMHCKGEGGSFSCWTD